MKILLFISVFILIMISGCKEDSPTEPEEFEITISGNVVDSDDNSIPDCNVILISEKDTLNTITESDGSFSFLLINTGIDSVVLKFINNNYEEYSQVIKDLSKENTTDLTIVLQRSDIIISGNLTELNEDGVHPSVNTLIRLEVVIGGAYFYDVVTDEAGDFLVQIDNPPTSEINGIIIEVEKQNYEPLFVSYYQPDDSTISNISIQIFKKVNYFPIKVGNKWEYEAYGSHGDGSYRWQYYGTEKLEITGQLNSDSFTITCIVNGSEIYKPATGSDITTYISNKKYELNIIFENGKPTLINCDSCSGGNYPVLKNIILNDALHFNYPVGADTIKVEDGYQHDGYEYSLLMNVGLTYFKSSYFDGLYGKSIYYKLINHDLK